MTNRHRMLREFTLFAAALLLAITGVMRAEQHNATHDSTAVHAQHGADSASHTGAEHHGTEHLTPGEEMMRILEHKVENTPYIHEYPFPELHLPDNWKINIAGVTINMSPNRHVVYMWLAMLLTVLLTWMAARQNRRGTVPKGYGNMVESVIVFIRDEVAHPFLHDATERYLPLLLSFFFFIATMNLIGLLPFGAAATGNINITAGMALITFSFMIFGGMRHNGALGFWKGLIPGGVPFALLPLMFLIELMGLLTKPFALAVRLFANMLSGALVIGAFYALIFGMDTVAVAPLSLAFLLFMSLLKIFVCLLQAYIFTMLSAFFISMSVHQHH